MNNLFLECPWDEVWQEDLERAASCIPWETLDGKTLLVTGATGLVGSALVKTLLACSRVRGINITIIAMVRSKEKAQRVFGHLLERRELRLYFGDVTRAMEVEGCVDFIFHAASRTASRDFLAQPVETIEIAFLGTKNVLELARRKDCEGVVYVSSMEVYGDPGLSDHRITEGELGWLDPLSVRSCYPEGKRLCECLCACYHSEYGVPVKIARLAQTFGAGVSPEEGRVFAQFAKAAMEGRDIVLHTRGESFGNYCYLADGVTGLMTVLLRGVSGEAYNVVSEAATMRIVEMARMVAREFGGGKSRVVFDIPENGNIHGYAPDTALRLSGEKLRNLGWEPDIAPDLPTMYRRMIASFAAREVIP